MGMLPFPTRTPKDGKQARGRTPVATTPIEIRTKLSLTDRFEKLVRSRLAAKIGHAASLIERGTVRFEDVNGPKGGVDTICKIHLVIANGPPVQVEARGERPDDAFNYALDRVARVLEKVRATHNLHTHRGRAARRGGNGATRSSETATYDDAGSLIGRRVGRGAASKAEALARPEKAARDHYVDTAAPGTSASDRRAGGPTTARRNTLAKPRRATAALEDSRTKPSRKSTRKSSNRAKPSQGKERTAVARSVTPSARATKRR